MADLAFFLVVWLLRLAMVIQVCEIHRDVHKIRRRDRRARVDFGLLSYVECAVGAGVAVAALVSQIDIAFWPIVGGLPVVAYILVSLIRYRLVLVGDRFALVGTKIVALDDIRCTFRGVSLRVDAGDRSQTVVLPIMRWDAMAEKLGAGW